ncbi:Rac5 protein, partial [Truncatella angustata]
RCVAVGDADCGKTQLLTALAGRISWGEYIPTVFDNYSMRCSVREENQGRNVELGLFDTAGQEEYRRLLPFTFAQADVFIVCFPADASMERLAASVSDLWLPEIHRVCPGAPFVVAAIHNDWDDADDVPGALLSIDPEDRVNFARKIGASGYFDIWPCTRIRVDQLLTEVSTRTGNSPAKSPMSPDEQQLIARFRSLAPP